VLRLTEIIKKTYLFLLKKLKRGINTMEKESSSIGCDRPIRGQEEDKFNFKRRIVDRIYPFLLDDSMLPLTVCFNRRVGSW
jgi:hypothetical protein